MSQVRLWFELEDPWLTATNQRLYLITNLLHETLSVELTTYIFQSLQFAQPIRPSRRGWPFLDIPSFSSQTFFGLLRSFYRQILEFPPSELRYWTSTNPFEFKLNTLLHDSEKKTPSNGSLLFLLSLFRPLFHRLRILVFFLLLFFRYSCFSFCFLFFFLFNPLPRVQFLFVIFQFSVIHKNF